MRQDMALERNDLPALDASLQQELASELLPGFRDLLEAEGINQALQQSFYDVYLPLAYWLTQDHPGKLQLVGLNGAQGAGKSTLAKILQLLLGEGFKLRTGVLSIDDLYLRRQQREELADTIHPLFRTRGVPGTHDVALGLEILDVLRNQEAGKAVQLPRFDKSTDDRLSPSEWTEIREPLDIVIFEGWCVGAQPQSEEALRAPVNILESEQDPDGRWRRASNRALAGDYQALFGQLDKLLMMKVPSFDDVFRWRSLQESKLGENASMGSDELRRFVMHYERLTRAQLEEMPQRADVVLSLDDAHRFNSVELRPGSLDPE